MPNLVRSAIEIALYWFFHSGDIFFFRVMLFLSPYLSYSHFRTANVFA
jgi:hypothetical protein